MLLRVSRLAAGAVEREVVAGAQSSVGPVGVKAREAMTEPKMATEVINILLSPRLQEFQVPKMEVLDLIIMLFLGMVFPLHKPYVQLI